MAVCFCFCFCFCLYFCGSAFIFFLSLSPLSSVSLSSPISSLFSLVLYLFLTRLSALFQKTNRFQSLFSRTQRQRDRIRYRKEPESVAAVADCKLRYWHVLCVVVNYLYVCVIWVTSFVFLYLFGFDLAQTHTHAQFTERIIENGKRTLQIEEEHVVRALADAFVIDLGGKERATDFGSCLAVITDQPQLRSNMGHQLAEQSKGRGLRGIGAIVYQQEGMKKDMWKVSLRSLEEEDTTAVAKEFGGGGHKCASSFGIGKVVFNSWKTDTSGTLSSSSSSSLLASNSSFLSLNRTICRERIRNRTINWFCRKTRKQLKWRWKWRLRCTRLGLAPQSLHPASTCREVRGPAELHWEEAAQEKANLQGVDSIIESVSLN